MFKGGRGRLAWAGAIGLALAVAGTTAVRADQFINILTGGTSGVYYPLGVALSTIYGNNIAGARTQVQSTKASVENLNLLQQGSGEIAFALGDSVKLAWEGNTEVGFPGSSTSCGRSRRSIPTMSRSWRARIPASPRSADLKGKSLSVGAPKSGTELNARAIFEAAGLTYDDLGRAEYLPFGESVELIKNRQLDATLQSAGLGVASIRDLAASVPILMVSVPADIVEKIGAPYAPGVIPAGTYEGQTADVPTAAITNILVTRADLDDETVYQMTKALFENLDEMVAAHAAAKAISIDTATKGLPIPLHPGAERYYKENGRDVAAGAGGVAGLPRQRRRATAPEPMDDAVACRAGLWRRRRASSGDRLDDPLAARFPATREGRLLFVYRGRLLGFQVLRRSGS